MAESSGLAVPMEQKELQEDGNPPSASPVEFATSTEEREIEEGNAFLRALFGGAQDLANLGRLPTLATEVAHQGDGSFFKPSEFSFRPYDPKLPVTVRARVTGKIGRKLYMVRDVEILTALYEYITRPAARLSTLLLRTPDQKIPCLARVLRQFSDDKQRRSNPRLYRGVASNFDCDNTSCTVYLVDYGEQVDCSAFLVYDLSNQATPVLETQTAAFRFQINGVMLDGKSCSVDFEMKDNCNYDLRLTGKDGDVFMGFVCMQSEACFGTSTRGSHSNRYEDGDRKTKELKELEKKKAELDERTKSLRTERQLFELQASERQQELMLMMIQLQCAQVSQKIDMIASSALYRSSMASFFSLGGMAPCWNPAAPMLPLMMPPYGHYSVGMPMVNQLMQSVENNSMAQLQNVPFNPPSSFPTFPNQQYPFFDGLVREPLANDNNNENASVAGRNNGVVEQQQIMSENVVSRRKQTSEICVGQSSPNMYRSNAYSNHVSVGRRNRRLSSEDYPKLSSQGNVTANKINASPPYLDSKRDSVCSLREPRKPEYGEPPRFLLETSPSKKQASVLQTRADAFSYGSRNSDKSSCAFNENSKVLEFRNSGRVQRGISSPRAVGKGFRQTIKRTVHVDEEQSVEVTGIVKPGLNDMINFFEPELDDDVEKQSKDTNSSSARRRGSIDLDEECVPSIIFSSNHLIKPLRYIEYVSHMDVEEGKEYVVKRSDDDRANSEWPLFFVQIQDEKLLDFIVEYLDSLHSDDILPEAEVVVGKLCLSYCHAFQAMFRAVITAVMETDVEVHYIDYGNYENVTRSELRTINDQPEPTRTHKAMAVPCIIRSLDEIDINTTSNLLEEDIAAIKEAVACDDERSFTLRFLRKRSDGVRVVELVKSSPTL